MTASGFGRVNRITGGASIVGCNSVIATNLVPSVAFSAFHIVLIVLRKAQQSTKSDQIRYLRVLARLGNVFFIGYVSTWDGGQVSDLYTKNL